MPPSAGGNDESLNLRVGKQTLSLNVRKRSQRNAMRDDARQIRRGGNFHPYRAPSAELFVDSPYYGLSSLHSSVTSRVAICLILYGQFAARNSSAGSSLTAYHGVSPQRTISRIGLRVT